MRFISCLSMLLCLVLTLLKIFSLCLSLLLGANSCFKSSLNQCFSTAGSRPTFGSQALTFGSPKPVFYYYNCNICVAKLYNIMFCGSPTTKRWEPLVNGHEIIYDQWVSIHWTSANKWKSCIHQQVANLVQ